MLVVGDVVIVVEGRGVCGDNRQCGLGHVTNGCDRGIMVGSIRW